MSTRNGHTPHLRLPQELLLLALNPASGRIKGNYLRLGLAGAVLMELSLLGHIALQGKKVLVVGPLFAGDPVLDRVMQEIDSARRPKSLKYWVRRLGNRRPNLIHEVAEGLVERDLIDESRRKFLGLIPYRVYPMPNPTPRQQIADRLRHGLLDSGSPPDARTATLAALGQSLTLLKEHFTRDERKTVRARIKQLRKDDAFANAVGETIAEVHAAVTAAVVAGAASAGSAGSG